MSSNIDFDIQLFKRVAAPDENDGRQSSTANLRRAVFCQDCTSISVGPSVTLITGGANRNSAYIATRNSLGEFGVMELTNKMNTFK